MQDDLISRQAVLDIINNPLNIRLDEIIKKLPSVLPKGHGRLKDVDHYIKMQWEHPDYSLMDDEPTIIEADEEYEDAE